MTIDLSQSVFLTRLWLAFGDAKGGPTKKHPPQEPGKLFCMFHVLLGQVILTQAHGIFQRQTEKDIKAGGFLRLVTSRSPSGHPCVPQHQGAESVSAVVSWGNGQLA